MTILNGSSSAIILTKTHPDLLRRLQDALAEPVDSYWNGSHTWFTAFEEIELEWRLHPVSGFTMPEASRPEDLFDLALEGEVDIEHYWEGLEVFAISEEEVAPNVLAEHVKNVLEIESDFSGIVDHDEVGNEYERNGGNVSIVKLLIEQVHKSDQS